MRITISFPDDGESVRVDMTGPAAPGEVRGAAAFLRQIAVTPGLAGLLAGGVSASDLPPSARDELMYALDEAAGPAVSPFEVL